MGFVASAQKIQYSIETQADALHAAKTKLGYTNNEDLLTFNWLYSLQGASTDDVVYDMSAPQALTPSGRVSMAGSPAAGAAVPALTPLDLKTEFSTTYDELKANEVTMPASSNSSALRRLGGVQLEVRAGGVGDDIMQLDSNGDVVDDRKLMVEDEQNQLRKLNALKQDEAEQLVKNRQPQRQIPTHILSRDGNSKKQMNLNDIVQKLGSMDQLAASAGASAATA